MSLPGPTQLGSFRQNLLHARRTTVNIVAYHPISVTAPMLAHELLNCIAPSNLADLSILGIGNYCAV